jgi:LPS export ABC transporter permease LptG
VAGEYALPLACCLAGFMALFILVELFDVLNDLISAKAPLGAMLRYFLLRQPASLVTVLPISLLLSAGYLVSNFSRNHELTALRACGVSVPRAFLPVWVIGALFSVVSYWTSERLAPACSAQAETLIDRLTASDTARARQKMGARLAFRSGRTNRDWFFASFDPAGEQRGVLVKQFREDRRVAWEVRAATATYHAGVWTLRDVIRIAYDEEGLLPVDAGRRLPTFEVAEEGDSPGRILASLKPAEELNVREMRQILAATPELPASTRRVFQTTIWRRLSFPFSCLAAAVCGVALSIGPQGGSRLRGFAEAIGLLLIYYVVHQLFGVLGKTGVLPPLAAGSVPTLLLLGWGLHELWRKR